MPDMLCSLVNLPAMTGFIGGLAPKDIHIRRVNPWEQTALREFITTTFSTGWADEAAIAFTHQPVSCFIATKGNAIIGFAAYECTRKNYFGPTGVDESLRGSGVGTALLIAALQGLRELGYTYAVIGGAGPVEFYKKAVGAILIPFDAGRGIYGLSDEAGYTT